MSGSNNNKLPSPSYEQLQVVESVKDGFNIKVDAVAGSGKTTTILHIAQSMPDKRILLVTYNRRLKEETRQRAVKFGLNNLEIHSYHGLCVKYYNTRGSRDQGIVETIINDMIPKRPIQFHIIILDEAQDIKPTYFNFISKVIKDNTPPLVFDFTNNSFSDSDDDNSTNDDPFENLNGVDDNDYMITSFSSSEEETINDNCDNADTTRETTDIGDTRINDNTNNTQICVLGDVLQNIYSFQESDGRYLSMADEVFEKTIPSDRKWDLKNLKTSFRITTEMAAFINRACLKESRMNAIKHGPKPKYLICNTFGVAIYKEAQDLLRRFKPSEIFIISPSIRSATSPIRRLENKLVQAGYPCYVPISDDSKLEESDCIGKIVFTTIHQVKGLERKAVILFNFDNSYFKYFKKDSDPMKCPNELYVAITRAQVEIILIHDSKKDYLQFLDQKALHETADVRIVGKFTPKDNGSSSSGSMLAVMDVIRHVKIETITMLKPFLKTIKIDPIQPVLEINIPTTVDGTIGTENVADINGTTIPAIYELFHSGQSAIIDYVRENLNKLPKAHQKKFLLIHKRYLKGVLGALKTNDFLYTANLYQSMRSGYQFKIEQISKYDWFPAGEISNVLKLMKKYISPAARYERLVMGSITSHGMKRSITGAIDIVDFESPLDLHDDHEDQIRHMYIWEVKCVSEISIEHILQIIIYAYMLETNPKYKKYKKVQKHYCVINLLKDELVEISPETDFQKIVQIIIDEKYKPIRSKNDREFLQQFV